MIYMMIIFITPEVANLLIVNNRDVYVLCGDSFIHSFKQQIRGLATVPLYHLILISLPLLGQTRKTFFKTAFSLRSSKRIWKKKLKKVKN
jgi:hypothetical protein